jgi:hypothetical protein
MFVSPDINPGNMTLNKNIIAVDIQQFGLNPEGSLCLFLHLHFYILSLLASSMFSI